MKIVLANYHLIKPGGTELWTYTIAKQLKRLGHTVLIKTKFKGSFFNKVMEIADGEYNGQLVDISIVNQACFFSGINARKHINVSHSPFLGMERLQPGYDKYFSVSEEIRELEIKNGFKSELLLNPIDLDVFHQIKSVLNVPKTVLFYSHYSSDSFNEIKSWCNDLGLNFIQRNNDKINNNALFNKADVVISVGRGALEALCAGRFVIGADNRQYTKLGLGGCGLIYDLDKAMYDNFTGRHDFKKLTKQTFKEYLKEYNLEKIDKTSQKCRKLCSVENIVDKLLKC